MHYWFEKPYQVFMELFYLYNKHIQVQSEQRFIIERQSKKVRLIEIVEINYIHRRTEFQIIIDLAHSDKGYASSAVRLAINYDFSVLNLYKLYLIFDKANGKAIHIYSKLRFNVAGKLIDEFFVTCAYRTVLRMCIF